MGSGVTKWASHACATGFHNVCGASIYCAHYPSQNHHHLPHVVCVAMWSFHLFRSFETKSFYHLCIVFYDEYTLNMSTTTTLAITWQLVYKRHVTRTIIPNSVLRESKNIIRIGDKKSMLEILIMIPSLLLNWLLSFIHHRHHHPWNTISFPHVGFVTSLLSCIVSKHYPHKGVFVPFFLLVAFFLLSNLQCWLEDHTIDWQSNQSQPCLNCHCDTNEKSWCCHPFQHKKENSQGDGSDIYVMLLLVAHNKLSNSSSPRHPFLLHIIHGQQIPTKVMNLGVVHLYAWT